MIGRIWTTRVAVERTENYEAFARGVSLPMFRRALLRTAFIQGRCHRRHTMRKGTEILRAL